MIEIEPIRDPAEHFVAVLHTVLPDDLLFGSAEESVNHAVLGAQRDLIVLGINAMPYHSIIKRLLERS